MDDVAIFIATPGHLMVADVHAKGDRGDGGDSGSMHHGGGSGSYRSEF